MIAIRTHSTDGTPAASDLICALLGVKNGRHAWNAVKKRTPELLLHIKSESRRGGQVDFVTATGFGILVANICSNKGRAVLTKLRTTANEIAVRYWSADATLVTDLVERIDDVAQLRSIAQHARSKFTQNRLADSIVAAGGTDAVCAMVNDKNDRAIRRADVPKRSSPLSFEELVNLQFVELHEMMAVKRLKAEASDGDILQAQARVLAAYKVFEK